MARFRRLAVVAALLSAVIAGASPALAEDSAAPVVGGEQLARSGRQVNLGPGAAPLPDIWARSWVLADATTGEILASKGAHKLRAPASTLKMLTAVTLLPRLDMSSTYVGRPSDPIPGTAMAGVKPGVTYTVKQLFNGMMLPSGNDAARALAHVNGGIAETVAQMNQVAASLGASDTVAKTPNGLDRKGQVSSAFDLALIARAGLARPDFAKIVARKKAPFPSEGGGTHPIYTTNRLLLGGYKGCIGVKTGFTTEAGRTFVGAATRKGRTLIVALMGIKSSSAQAAAAALTWGFANADKLTPVGTLNVSGSAVPAAQTNADTQVREIELVPSGPPATAAIAVPDVSRTSWPPVVWYALIGLVVAGVLLWAWLRRKSRTSPYSVI